MNLKTQNEIFFAVGGAARPSLFLFVRSRLCVLLSTGGRRREGGRAAAAATTEEQRTYLLAWDGNGRGGEEMDRG